MIVRETYENCKKVRNILQTHMVEHEQRDIFMSKQNQKELQERLGQPNVDVPQVFVDGQLLGVSLLGFMEKFDKMGSHIECFQNVMVESHVFFCNVDLSLVFVDGRLLGKSSLLSVVFFVAAISF